MLTVSTMYRLFSRPATNAGLSGLHWSSQSCLVAKFWVQSYLGIVCITLSKLPDKLYGLTGYTHTRIYMTKYLPCYWLDEGDRNKATKIVNEENCPKTKALSRLVNKK